MDIRRKLPVDYGDVVDGPCTASMCQEEVVEADHLKEPSMVEITTIGVDIAKTVFQVHGIDASGNYGDRITVTVYMIA